MPARDGRRGITHDPAQSRYAHIGITAYPITYCFADATGETLVARLRRGNAGANNIADHVALLDAAIAGLPAEIAVGHRPGERRQPGAPARVSAHRLRRLRRLGVARPQPQRRLRRDWPQ